MAEETIASCTFTAAAGTDVNALTPEVGEAFVRHVSFSTPMVVTDANRARNDSGSDGVAVYLNGTVPTNADYKVGATIRHVTDASPAYMALAGRVQTDAFTMYLINQLTPGTWALGSIVAGIYTELAAYSQSLVNGTDYDLELQFHEDTITVVIDGDVKTPVVDSSIPGKGRGAIVSYTGVTNSTGQHVDDFYITEETASHPVGTESVTLSEAGVQFSPFNWRTDGDSRVTIYPGAYLKRSLKTTYCALIVDVSAMAAFAPNVYPVIEWRVDDGEWQEHQFTEAPNFKVLFEDETDAFHDVEIVLIASDAFSARWNETSSLIVDGLQLDTGWESDDIDEPTDTILFYGDSIPEGAGQFGAATTGAQYVAFENARSSYAALVAAGLGARDCRSALGGTGWDAAFNSDVPAFPDTWDKYSSGNSRLSGGSYAGGDPTWIHVDAGTNGGLAAASTLTNWLTGVRAAAPTSRIVVKVPFGQGGVANLTSGFNSYQTATPDSLCKLINLGAIDGVGTTIGPATNRTTDNVHLTQLAGAELAAIEVAAIKDAFAVAGGVPRSRLINAGAG